jgi:hypothetical protein
MAKMPLPVDDALSMRRAKTTHKLIQRYPSPSKVTLDNSEIAAEGAVAVYSREGLKRTSELALVWCMQF